MAALPIPNDVLNKAGISDQEARLELACRLFQTGRLTLFLASQLAGMSQEEFEDVLLDRQIPIYRYSEEDLKQDLQTLRRGEG